MTSVLIIDDDPLVTRFMELGLRAEGFATEVARDASTGFAMAMSGEFDLVLLDLVLRGSDGFSVLRDLRSRRSTLPVLVVTGHPAERDVVAGLEAGADDYLVKPFVLAELVARVKALLRRRGATATFSSETIAVGPLEVDIPGRRARVNGVDVDLTKREFDLLAVLAEHKTAVLSRAQLLELVWGYDFAADTNVVDVFIGYLRRKLEAGGASRLLHTVRGVGFVLRQQ